MTIPTIQSKKELPQDSDKLRDFSWELVLQYHKLYDQYQLLCKNHFGKSSEKSIIEDSDQVELDDLLAQLESIKHDDSQQEEFVEVPSHKRRINHPGRNAIPDNIPREEIILDIPEEEKVCNLCHNDRTIIDYKEHSVVERIPAQYKVIVYKRPIYGCSGCKDTLAIAEPSLLPISKGLAGVNLLTFVILSKYLYHLPLYRIQRQIYHESRIWFTRATMVGWIRKLCELLQSLYDELLIEYRKSRIRHADESRIPVQEKNGKIHNRWLWVGVNAPSSDNQVVVFMYNRNRSSKAASGFLGDAPGGYLMVDDLASYEGPIRDYSLNAQLCMVHSRRKFVEALNCGIRVDFDKWVIRKIGQLYRIERYANKKDLDAKVRYALRQKYSSVVLAQIKERLMNPGFTVLPKSRICNAINYMLGNWARVTRFLEDGDLPIDNNPVEQIIRPLAIGRNNWKKAGSESGAQWTAIIYSLIATCKINNVDPHKYFLDILKRLPMRADGQSVKDLTPAKWIKQKDKSNATTDYPKS